MRAGMNNLAHARAEPSPEEVAAFAAACARALPAALSRYGVEDASAEVLPAADGSFRLPLAEAGSPTGEEAVVSGTVDRFIFLRGNWDGPKRVEGLDPGDLAAALSRAAGCLLGKFQKDAPSSSGRRSAARERFAARLAPLAGAAVAALGSAGFPGAEALPCRGRSKEGDRSWGEIALHVPGRGAFPILVEAHERPLYRVAVLAGGAEIHATTYEDARFAAGFAAFYWHHDRHGPIGGTEPTPRESRARGRAAA